MSDVDSIHDLFGSFRAEWLRDDIYNLFSEPTYFAHLLGNKSCVLMGGRGSGKTTVLRCMSYEGQEALHKQDWDAPTHVGVYYRVNTNIVTAFQGPELSIDEWRRLFGHFLNLTICSELANYLNWQKTKRGNGYLNGISFSKVGLALGVGKTGSLKELLEGIEEASILLELYINNLGGDRPKISQLQSPITSFLSVMKDIDGHRDASFHIILDEYENFLSYQQEVVNTLIKHSGDNCYFKIGVRELGWKVHTTLNETELLISPADYELIHIEQRLKKDFSEFARTVCESRLKSQPAQIEEMLGLDQLLPTLSATQEAERLGVKRRADPYRKRMLELISAEDPVHHQHDFVIYVFFELNGGDAERAIDEINSYVNKNAAAVNRFHNYSNAFLFSIAEKGNPIPKHYCGHKTFARMANQNIRFYMQLVHESVVQQIEAKKDLSVPIDCKDQTIAAHTVGLNYLRELEGVTAKGGQLSKLILGFGRFFQLLAANPADGAPECNQFEIKDILNPLNKSSSLEASTLLTEAIMHLAMVRSPGTKLAAESDIRAWDYSPHPIFAAYFNYSSRRKRKFSVSDSDFVLMSSSPQATIKRLLGEHRQHLMKTELPPQMSMFDEFFN